MSIKPLQDLVIARRVAGSHDLSSASTKYRGCGVLGDVGPSHPFRQASGRKSVAASN